MIHEQTTVKVCPVLRDKSEGAPAKVVRCYVPNERAPVKVARLFINKTYIHPLSDEESSAHRCLQSYYQKI